MGIDGIEILKHEPGAMCPDCPHYVANHDEIGCVRRFCPCKNTYSQLTKESTE